jgi:membrane protein DedA with SNARE-associated domain
LAVPLNPLFDVAGLAAGAMGMRYRVFFIAVFAARIVRFALIIWLGVMLGLGVPDTDIAQ